MTNRPLNGFERRKQRTREQLKQAALNLTLEKGYDAVSVQDITDRADLGRGTFYVHFADKEDLIWSALREGFEVVNEAMMNDYEHEQSPRLEYLIWRRMFEYAGENRALYKVMLAGQGSGPLADRVQSYFASEVEAQVTSGRCFVNFTPPAPYIAQFVSGAIVRMLTWWLNVPNDYTPRQMAGFFYEMIFHQPPPDP